MLPLESSLSNHSSWGLGVAWGQNLPARDTMIKKYLPSCYSINIISLQQIIPFNDKVVVTVCVFVTKCILLVTKYL